MAKNVPAALLTDLAELTISQAMIVQIKRQDGTVLRMTNHDVDITFEGFTYRHDIPFTIGAISTLANSGQVSGVDNVQLKLFCDGTTIVKSDFENKVWDYAAIEIRSVNFEDTSHGAIWLRKGWFGEIKTNEHDVVAITITGLLKVLDFEIGRTYTSTCDADLGDSRCKFAIDPSKAHSPLNIYSVGDWVYRYNTSVMTALTVTNSDFTTDGARTSGQAITGWTKSNGSAFIVSTDQNGLSAYNGSYALFGTTDSSADGSGAEQSLYQDIDLVAQSVDTAKIDAGKIALYFATVVGAFTNTKDPIRLKVEMLNADDEVFAEKQTPWYTLDDVAKWRERFLVFELRPGTRTIRLHLMMKKQDGPSYNASFGRVLLKYWDITTVTPTANVVHNLTRSPTLRAPTTTTQLAAPITTGDPSLAGYFYPKNFDFENSSTTETSQLVADIANALSPSIPNWETMGSWWRVVSSLSGFSGDQHGSYFLVAGNDGTGVQRTDTITQTFNLLDRADLSTTLLDAGKYAAWFNGYVQSASASAKASITLEQYTAADVLLDTVVVRADATVTNDTQWHVVNKLFQLKATCRKIKLIVTATSPTGSGNGAIGFDNFSFFYFDQSRATVVDNTDAQGGTEGTVTWATSSGDYTYDGDLVWLALSAQRKYDVVASVTDKRTFTATVMSGSAGDYETGTIEWLSGANAGQKNIVRIWGVSPKTVKMYFQSPSAIAVGDRFAYTSGCQKRFNEDCVARFKNGLNFRGFPYVPGNLKKSS